MALFGLVSCRLRVEPPSGTVAEPPASITSISPAYPPFSRTHTPATKAHLSMSCSHENFRRHVLNCSTERVRHVALHDRLLAKAEIREFDMSVGVEKYVLGFEISVDDPYKRHGNRLSPAASTVIFTFICYSFQVAGSVCFDCFAYACVCVSVSREHLPSR